MSEYIVDSNAETTGIEVQSASYSEPANGLEVIAPSVVVPSIEVESAANTDAAGSSDAVVKVAASDAAALEVQDDSEAETILSSPVKRRYDQNVAEGQRPRDPNPEPGPSTTQIRDDTDEHLQNGQIESSLSSYVTSRNGTPAIQAPNLAVDVKVEDVTTDPSNSKPADRYARSLSESINPLKRKYRETSTGSIKRTSVEPPTHRRRRSVATTSKDAASPISREESIEKTRSPARKDNEKTAHRPGKNIDQARKRRAQSQMTHEESKTVPSMWGESSDSSSGDAAQSSADVGTARVLNRSVSTPGRPPGRDHKRHVNRYGFTRLAEACENGDLDAVKVWRIKDPEQLEQREFAGNTPLQIAALNGNTDLVRYLLDEGCNKHCANTDKDTPLIDAVENGHADVVKILLEAGVNPLWLNMKGQQALDLIGAETEHGTEMRIMLRDYIEKWREQDRSQDAIPQDEDPSNRPGPKQGLHFMARTPANLLKLVTDNDRSGVQEFLDARVPVDNNIVAAAARTGDVYLLNMLMAELSPGKAKSRAEKPMLAVIGTSHYEMVKTLTELDQFDACWRSKANRMTWFELAEHRQGPKWKEEKELLYHLYKEHLGKKRSGSSPLSSKAKLAQRQKPNGVRLESDMDSDRSESPDRARHRRRLKSRKDMRATSRTSSRSVSPSVSVRSRHSDAQESEPEDKPIRRKVGRPRTKSLSTQTVEPKIKRIRSSSIKDKAAIFGVASPLTATKHGHLPDTLPSHVNGNKPRSSVLQDLARRELEQREKAEAERVQQAAADERARKVKTARQAAEAAEQAARLQQEEEARLIAQRNAEMQSQKNNLLSTLPSSLQFILTNTFTSPKDKVAYIRRHFLPLQVVQGKKIAADGDDGAAYVLTFQAAGLFGSSTGFRLLGFEEGHSLRNLPDLLDLTMQEREAMLPALRGTSLVHGHQDLLSELDRVKGADDAARFKAECEILQNAEAAVDTQKDAFLAMPSLKWVSLQYVLDLIAAIVPGANIPMSAIGTEDGMRPFIDDEYAHIPVLKFHATRDVRTDARLSTHIEEKLTQNDDSAANGIHASENHSRDADRFLFASKSWEVEHVVHFDGRALR